MITVRIEGPKDDDMAAIQVKVDLEQRWLKDRLKVHDEGLCSQRLNFRKKLAEAQKLARDEGYAVLIVRVYAAPAE